MSFTTAVTFKFKVLNGWKIMGTYANTSGSVGGTVKSGTCTYIYGLQLQSNASTTSPYTNVPGNSWPVADSTGVPIVTAANDTGTWEALGV